MISSRSSAAHSHHSVPIDPFAHLNSRQIITGSEIDFDAYLVIFVNCDYKASLESQHECLCSISGKSLLQQYSTYNSTVKIMGFSSFL